MTSLRRGFPVPIDQNLGNFGARKLLGRHLAVAQKLANFRATQENMVLLAMGTRFARLHSFALGAEEGVIKKERRDSQLPLLENVKNKVGVVGSVIVPDAGVIASYDKMRAAIVLANDRVEDRFPGSRVAHRRGVDRQYDAVFGNVALDERFIALHPDVRRNIVALGFADDRMNQQAIGNFE